MVVGLCSCPLHWLFPLPQVTCEFLLKCHLLDKAFLDLPHFLFLHLPYVRSRRAGIFKCLCLSILCIQSRAWHTVGSPRQHFLNERNLTSNILPSFTPTHRTLGTEAALKPENTIYFCTKSLSSTVTSTMPYIIRCPSPNKKLPEREREGFIYPPYTNSVPTQLAAPEVACLGTTTLAWGRAAFLDQDL